MSRAAGCCLLAGLLLGGCRDAPPAGTETPAGPRAPATESLQAEPPALEPIPRPDLSALQQPVQEQIQREIAGLEAMLADETTPAAEIAERFGLLGRLYHGYGLDDSAASAYRNARRLDATDYRWPYLLGVVAHIRGDRPATGEHLRRARELAPDDVPTALRLAELRLSEGELDGAEELFREALGDDPDSAFAAYGLARIANARKEYATAIEQFQRVLELQPEAVSVHYLLGQAHRNLGNRQAAERHLALAGGTPVALDDPLVDGLADLLTGVGIHLEQGLQAFGDGDTERALAEYRAALEIEPDNATALRGVALTLANAERNREAAREYERMLEIHPDHQLARMEYGTVLLNLGQNERAIDSLRAALRTDPDFKAAHFNLATAYSRLDRWQETADEFREVLRIDRDDHQARYYLAVALDELGRLDEAVPELRRVIAQDPDHLLARQRLGSVLDRSGDARGAIEQFQAVLGLEAPDQEKALAHYQIGRLLILSGQEGQALDHFQRAVELFPQFWQARFAVANWLDRHGRHREAAEIFGRLRAADPSNIPAREREAEALIGDGRFAEARRRLDEGLAAHPRSMELATVLARLLATADDAGVRDGERALELAERLFAARRSVDQAELVAMALAELGRFDEAAAWQRRVLALAESEGDAEAIPRLRRHLSRYESRQPVRQGRG